MAQTNREWNSEAYHRVSRPQFEWGLKVLDRLPLRGDETVADAGCGSGKVTARFGSLSFGIEDADGIIREFEHG